MSWEHDIVIYYIVSKYSYEDLIATGFGRDEGEASLNCVKNFIDCMLAQEDRIDLFNVLKASLKELKEPDEPADSNYSSLFNNSFE